uniref:DNA-directed RNA polymerase subunit n=1 Tax=Corethron hystrix TaxID=216773 RepID=A0A7S1BRD5_9STRA|mmetsp:Transcript_3831/g.7206  ORF Transcript_3831/g.7206 Transcript_3831/m.7206 type:complete len:980 (+) Transcript_3831:221-3160(+)
MPPNSSSENAEAAAPVSSSSSSDDIGYLTSLLGRRVDLGGDHDNPGGALASLSDDPIHKSLIRDNYSGPQGESEGVGGVGGTSTSFNPQPKRIAHLQFGTLSEAEIHRTSEFAVTSRELFTMPSRAPAPGGCLDPRLGVSDKVSSCKTCGRKLQDCAGHFGHIPLALPVFHIGFFKHILSMLQCICKGCSRILLAEPERMKYLKKFRHPRTDVLARASITKKVIAACKKNYICPHCHKLNGTVKRIAGVTTLKIVHERFTGRRMEDELESLLELTHDVTRLNNDFAKLMSPPGGPVGKNGIPSAGPSVVEDLLPTRVLELFRRIPDDDCEVLWTDPTVARPENLIIQSVLVPPVPIRPSVAMDTPGGGSNEDDLTVKLQEIIDVNVALGIALAAGQPSRMVMETWDFLQVQVAQYINGEMPGIAKPMGAMGGAVRPIRGLCQRLKGKQGRFRQNLSGKRVDFSARTVISPDPNLEINQVGVPVRVAKIMTYPEKVSRYNIEKLRKLVINGPDVHPGANLIRTAGENSFAKSLAYGNRSRAAESLKIGDTVERHMEDGDVVLFNRQPSLHRVSIMSHRAKIMEWRTFRFNIQVCAPYNADFDGDEMNMHLPQTEEAKAEAGSLMDVTNNLITPRNGEPLVAASQDFLSTSYLLTQRDIFFNWNEFSRIAAYFSLAEEEVIVPIPAILKPVALWTGKQVFSLIVKPNDPNSKVLVSLEMKEKNYDGKKNMKHFCPNDGWVAFRNSELISGNVAKKTIGDGSKTGLLYVLLQDQGPKEAVRYMNRFSRLCTRFFGMHKGFSIGISDVTPSPDLRDMKARILDAGFKKSTESIASYEKGSLELRPGCDLLQSLEEILNGVLGKLRESAGQEAMRTLPWTNTPRIMAECGSKGSPLNISQMMACVGQQAVGGNRIQDGFVNRTLPHFEYGSLTPSAKGFVANSFYTGLTATEFFFHTMGGREGLVDTAVKTAETGYMARRLMKV